MHTGYDGTQEELRAHAMAATARGLNCLTFEGPGQGAVIREQGLGFRPDWEAVVTPVVDYVLGLPTVDPERIALLGISFGGYLAPRAAAFEHRLAACIANGGVFDFMAPRLPSGMSRQAAIDWARSDPERVRRDDASDDGYEYRHQMGHREWDVYLSGPLPRPNISSRPSTTRWRGSPRR